EEVVLTEPRVSAAGTHLIFTLTGTPRTTYAIESSTNLTSWKLERVTTLPLNGAANLSLPLPGGTIPGFWRAVPLGDVSSPARISIEAIGANREFLRLRIEGTPGLTYRIESSTNLINWNQLFPFAITIPPNSTQATFNLFGNRTARFSAFRAVAGPR
ncbi:MAG: hypothetical protein JNL97_09345, partial [Verrucomicrobiales bacterium]|nr:hypothetical protein [Verrucomicrobiales bacterium]